MIYSVSSYSFSKLFGKTMEQEDCIAKAAEMGFDGIEFSELIHNDGRTDEEYAVHLKELAAQYGLVITNFTFGADLLNGSDGNLEEEIAKVKHKIDLAALMGATSVRHDCTIGYPMATRSYRGFENALPRLAAACKEITKYAKTKGIRTMIENHGQFSQDSDRVEKLVNTVADDNFGLLVDIGNFLCADEDPATAVGRVAPYAFHVHAKDFHLFTPMQPNPGRGFFQTRNGTYLRGAIIGHGVVPIKHCLTALKRIGYDHVLSIEFEGMEDPILAISIGLENLKRFWEEI